MPNRRSLTIFALGAGLLFGAVSHNQAQTVLFSDDFDSYSTPSTVTSVGTTNGYKILFSAGAGASDFTAIFGYDYSADGIPSAPDSTGGTTKGLRLNVNRDANPQVAAVNLYPTNKSFGGNFSVKYDIYLGYLGPNGSTEHALVGINHSGNFTNRVGQVGSDGLFFAMDGDGGASATSTTLRDYSCFRGAPTAIPTLLLTNTAGFTFGPTPPLGGRFSALDAGFQSLFPSGAPVGTAGNGWVQGEVRQETNVVTWLLNNTIVAQYTNTSVYGSGDILLGYNDAFASIGSNLTFVVFDNISVTSLGGLPTVSVTAAPTTVTEGGASSQFTLTRAGDTSSAITINYTMSGTASNGLDYTTLSGSVTLAAGATSTNVTLTAIHDGISEPIETAVMSVAGGTGYTVGSPAIATVTILDIDTPAVSIGVSQPILLEGVSAASVPMTLTRFGQTNTALSVNISYSGSATLGADFNGASAVSIPAGAVTATFNITPINDTVVEGTETSIVTVAAGTGYVPGTTPSATNYIVDDDVLPGATMFFDSFDSASVSNNWIVNQSSSDTYADFGYDYSVDGIPEAPSTPAGAAARHGLKLRVNETLAAVAGLSVSPTNADFEGNFRLRFDMWLNYAGPLNNGNVPGQTQCGTAGVGTTGGDVVWPSSGSISEGVWFSATCDGGSAALAGDYNAYATTTLLGDASGVYAAGTTNGPRDNLNPYYNPWPAVSAPAAEVTAHPAETGTTGVGTFGMSWHKVVITKRLHVVSWDVDGRRLATVDADANGVTLSTNVFVGFHDPFASVTTNAAAQFGLFDNIRVESLGRPLLTSSSKVGTTVTIAFMGEAGDATTDFEVQAAPAVTGPYTSTASTITQVDATHFTATVTSAGGMAYFKIHRL